MSKTTQKQIMLVLCFVSALFVPVNGNAIDITSSVIVSILPNSPTNLSANSPSYNQINISWTDNSNNESGFSIERKTNSGTYTEIATTNQNIANYSDNSISANTSYTYRVRAISIHGYSDYSNEASSATSGAPTPPTPPSSGGGGGGGGGSGGGTMDILATLSNKVLFRGIAYPKSKITLLKDAQITAVSVAGADAKFEIQLAGVTSGKYNFGILAEDQQGNKSTIHQFNILVTTGVTTVISGIFIAPTIQLDKLEVARGEPISIIGQSAPSSTVSIVVNSEKEIIKKTEADSNGLWTYKFDTSLLEFGNHSAKANSATNEDISTFSKSVGFKVGTKTVLAPKTNKKDVSKVDANGDGRINLVDFSIMAYWYKRPLSSASAKVREQIDINKDGKIDLVDFSILAYYWTG